MHSSDEVAKQWKSRCPNCASESEQSSSRKRKQTQACQSGRLYARISAAKVRRELVERYGYREEELPSSEWIRRRLNQMGYRLKRVQKTKPQKVIPETPAILAEVTAVKRASGRRGEDVTNLHRCQSDREDRGLRPGGRSRALTEAYDHDFKPTATVTPFGIFAPELNGLWLYLVTTKVTADCIVDCIERWWHSVKEQFSHIERLVINADNGPENHSRRTQFMNRLTQFARREQLTVELAYYPPYHSKYNAVERAFGWLEQHWRGSLLDSVETVEQFARTLRFKGKAAVVELVTDIYESGARLSQKAMEALEEQWGTEKEVGQVVPGDTGFTSLI